MVQHYDKATPKYKQIYENSRKNNLDEIVLLHDEVISNNSKKTTLEKEPTNNSDLLYINKITELASNNGELQHKLKLATNDLNKTHENIKDIDKKLHKAEEYIELLGGEDAIEQAIENICETDLVDGYVMKADGTIYRNPPTDYV